DAADDDVRTTGSRVQLDDVFAGCGRAAIQPEKKFVTHDLSDPPLGRCDVDTVELTFEDASIRGRSVERADIAAADRQRGRKCKSQGTAGPPSRFMPRHSRSFAEPR